MKQLDVRSVPVKPDWQSKINWIVVAQFVAMMFAVFGVDVDADTLNKIVVGIGALSSVLVLVVRTWFTTALTKSSVM